MPLLTPEMMRALELNREKRPIFFVSIANLLYPDRKVFYCEACDEMVEIGRFKDFKPGLPWRSDVFKIGAKSVRDVASI